MPPSQTHFGWLLQQGRNTEEYKGTASTRRWTPRCGAVHQRPDQVRTRVAFALSEIFVVNVASITASWLLFGAAGFMDLLAEHALGNYRSLLAAVSRNLSMGCMLTYRGSRKEDPRTGRHPDENYARGHAAVQHRPANRIPTARPAWKAARRWKPTNADVQGLAGVFTGWDLDGPETDVEFHRRPMKLDPALHSMAEKRFLGTVIPAGTGGNRWRWPWTRSRPIPTSALHRARS